MAFYIFVFVVLLILALLLFFGYAKFVKGRSNKSGIEALLAMPLLRDMEFDYEAVIRRLREHWKIPIKEEDIEGAMPDEKICIFNVGEHRVGLSLFPCPIPDGEFDRLFPFSPYWEDAEKETKEHQSHAIVFLHSGSGTAVEHYSLFTKVVESILVETNSLGVYQGNQTLLISRENYINLAECLRTDDGGIPLPLWVFFAMAETPKGNTLYTYGLTGFGKLEMEILDSSKDMEELLEFLMNITSYVITGDITFKEGETLGYTQDADATIRISKGVCHDGRTIKLVM
jgi:hypothetical protein